MVNMTLAIPEKLKSKMDAFPEMNWSEVARQAIKQRVEDMEFLKKFKAKSRMTEKDALELGKKVNKNLAKKYRGK